MFFITDDTALVINTIQPNPQSLIQSKNKIKEILGKLNSKNRHEDYSFSHSQIEHLLSFLSRSFPFITSRYNHNDLDILLAISLKLPDNPIGNYVNISTELIDGNNLYAGTTKIGDISVSNKFFFNTGFYFASLLSEPNLVDTLKTMADNTSFTQENVAFKFDQEVNTQALLNLAKKDLKKVRSMVWDDKQFAGVDYYYNHLLKFSKYTQNIDQISLFEYLKPIFSETISQSSWNEPSKENSDALLALALLAGDHKLRAILSQLINIQPSSNAYTGEREHLLSTH